MANTTEILTFGQLIKVLRKEKNISMYDIEREVGISPSYICRLEKGSRKNPTIDIITRLSKYFDIPISVIEELYPEVFKQTSLTDLEPLDELILKSEFIFANVESNIDMKLSLQKLIKHIEIYLKEENRTSGREEETIILKEIDKLKENVKSA